RGPPAQAPRTGRRWFLAGRSWIERQAGSALAGPGQAAQGGGQPEQAQQQPQQGREDPGVEVRPDPPGDVPAVAPDHFARFSLFAPDLALDVEVDGPDGAVAALVQAREGDRILGLLELLLGQSLVNQAQL